MDTKTVSTTLATAFEGDPDLAQAAILLRDRALQGDDGALELLILIHRHDENRIISKKLGEAWSRSIEKTFAPKEPRP